MVNTYGLNSRLNEHERLVDFLDTMAVMLDCSQTLNSHLPDATRPDVVRLNTKAALLFIGDAKNTESPNSRFTQERLFNYMEWLPSFLSENKYRKVIFAIGHNKSENIHAWLNTLVSLFSRSYVSPVKYGVEEFDSLTYIAWIQAKGF